MVEPVAPPAEPPATPPEPTPIPLADADGNLRDGWLESLDEKYRDEPYLKEVKNIKSMASSVVSARGMVGKDKIVKPNVNSSDEDWEAYYIAGGRPDTAGDYNIVRPEELPEENWNSETALAAQDLFHKIGLNSKQALALTEFNNANVLAAIKAQNEAIIANRQAIKDGLFSEWGAAYPQKEHQGNYAIDKGTSVVKIVDGVTAIVVDEEFKARLTAKFGDDPDFIRFTSNLGGKFAEHGDIVATHIPTPGDIQTKIDEIMAKPAYTNEKLPGHEALVKQVQDLYKEKNKPTNR